MVNQKKQDDEQRLKFSDFIRCFSEVEWPAILTEESYRNFSDHNKPIPQLLLDAFVNPFEEVDEHTEFIPCLTWKVTDKVTAIIYWKASLLQYQYVLATYDENGLQLDNQTIAGAVYSDRKIIRKVSTIISDNNIQVVEGAENITTGDLNAAGTNRYALEILEDGEVVYAMLKEK